MAQKIKVKEGNSSFSNGSHNSLTVMVYETDEKSVEKAWKSYTKKWGGKVSVKKEVFSDDCRIKDLGDNTFDIYAKVEEKKNEEVELIVCVDLGGAYLNSGAHSKEFKTFEKELYDFAVQTTKEGIQVKVKMEEKNLKDLEKDQKDLEKENEKMHKDIEKSEKEIEAAKKAIEQSKKDIEQNKADQEMKKTAIKGQEKILKEVQDREKAVN